MIHDTSEKPKTAPKQGQHENSITFDEKGQDLATQTDLNKEEGQIRQMWTGGDGEPYDEVFDPKHKPQGIPETVSNRYLNVESKYFFPDKTVAFEDRGTKLKLDTENREVIKDVLTIAEARGWRSISVSGSQNFKFQVWREATIMGLGVSGYTPTALEAAELNHAQALREARQSALTRNPQTAEKPQHPQDGLLRGILTAHGADHYRHDPKQGQSYYVTVDVGNGNEVTRWGSDFKRALAKAHSLPQIGDAVIIAQLGKQNVDIEHPVVDDQGHVAQEKKTVQKTTWQVEKAGYYDTIKEQADALRFGKEIERRVIVDNPQLANALAVSKLGEKIAAHAKETGALRSQGEVDTLVNHINAGLADALVNGKTIKTPEIQALGKQAAISANHATHDTKPPEQTKAPHAHAIGQGR